MFKLLPKPPCPAPPFPFLLPNLLLLYPSFPLTAAAIPCPLPSLPFPFLPQASAMDPALLAVNHFCRAVGTYVGTCGFT